MIRALKQYIELYHLYGIADFFLNQKTQEQKPPVASRQTSQAGKQTTVQRTFPPNPAGLLVHSTDLYFLEKSYATCQKCSYHLSRIKFVYGNGDPHAKCMIIANPPNSDENGWGRSGMGDSWEIFNRDIVKALNSQEKLNIKCGDFFQTNITKCSIHSVDMRNVNNIRQVNINYPEMKKCLPFLDQQIEIIQPKIILVFGEIAANVLFEKNENLAFFRKNKGLAYKNIPVIVTDYPPRFPRKNQATNQADNFKHDKQLMWNDLKLFCSIYKEL